MGDEIALVSGVRSRDAGLWGIERRGARFLREVALRERAVVMLVESQHDGPS